MSYSIHRRPPLRKRHLTSLARTGVIALVLVAVLLATVGVELYTDYLWFESVGFQRVFTTMLIAQVGLFAMGALVFLVLFMVNVIIARRLAYRLRHIAEPEEEGIWAFIAQVGARIGAQREYAALINASILVIGVLLSVLMGLLVSGQWETVLRYLNATSFAVQDPIFGLDISFFVFTLPLLQFLQSWWLGTLILVATATVAVYAVVVAYELGVTAERVLLNLPRGVRLHLATLLALVWLVVASNHILDTYDLLFSNRGAAYGASYADVKAQLPALLVMAGAAAVASVLTLASALARSFRPLLVGVGLWGLVAGVGGLLYPNMVESFEVKPDQLRLERPYIENTIRYTLQAYGLDKVEEQFFPAEDAVSLEDVRANQDTIVNIRLWDHRPLRETYNQIQSIRTYYTFEDVDIDRYYIDGQYRQVMVSARELMPEGLGRQALTWVNQRLQWTHGYGVVMSPVNAVADEGRPQLFLQDVPPTGIIPLQRPEIYYGERTRSYVVVKTSEDEFDYPRGNENVRSQYQARSGVVINSLLRRIAFALRFRDGNLLLTPAIRPDSEVLFRRNIAERVSAVAPFLLLDRDPYIVVADGRLYWVQDAYTYTAGYPYSQPTIWRPGRGRPVVMNYIRNSVKAVVDAYDGSVRLYVVDPGEPLISTYSKIFPDLFSPLDAMPASLRAHLRYPEDLFTIQANMYRTYHMQDPTVFYNKEDAWDIPWEKFYNERTQVEPYYVIMRLPGEEKPEFILMQPFTPLMKDNLIGWMAGRSDAPHYGKLLVFKYPKEKLAYGPFQVEGRIDQDPSISAQFTLWSQAGSRVIRGNMLVIPLGKSNLYVEPIYLQAENGPIPELKRVIVATGNRVVMEPSLEEAIARLFGQQAPAPSTEPAKTGPIAPSPPVPAGLLEIVRSAQDHYARAQEALRSGDWARYGEELKAMESDLKRLAELAGQP